MRAVILENVKKPLQLVDVPIPEPLPGQVRIRVEACGVCRTDLHIAEGELPNPKLPLILGHQIVGKIDKVGEGVYNFKEGMRVGVPWLGWVCNSCIYCNEGKENLCPEAKFTGYTLQGGFAEYTVAWANFCYTLSSNLTAYELAPLLCAGLIGYRTLSKAGYAPKLGIFGFGAAAHLVIQIAVYQGRKVYVFTKPGDKRKQTFAMQMGAVWAGGSDELPPQPLDAALIFAPAGDLVLQALRVVKPGGIVICGGIHMSNIPSIPYQLIWMERKIESVANLTRQDGEIFLRLAERIPIKPIVNIYKLEQANQALEDIRLGRIEGAAVLEVNC